LHFPSFSLIESPPFVKLNPPFVKLNILLRVKDNRKKRAFLALAFTSEALEVVVCDVL